MTTHTTLQEPTGEMRALITLNSPTEERNERTLDLDMLDTADLVQRITTEDEHVIAAVHRVRPQLAALVDRAVQVIRSGNTVHYFGAGTSGRLGILDAVELMPTYRVGGEWVQAHLAGGERAMLGAVEGVEDLVEAGRADAAAVREGDLVIGIAASGRTPYVAGAFDVADELDAYTALISSNPHAELAARVTYPILLDTGPEVVTGSTRMKAATAQKMVLNTFSTATMVRLGKTYSNLMVDVQPTNQKLRARTIRLLVQATGLPAERCEDALRRTGNDVKLALILLLRGALPEGAAESDPAVQQAIQDAATALSLSGGVIRRALQHLDHAADKL